MIRFLILGLACLAFLLPAIGQDESRPPAPPPALEAYGQLPFVSSARLSPDGSKIAAIFNIDGVSALQVLNAEGDPLYGGRVDNFKARGLFFYDNDHVILGGSETTRLAGFRGDFEYSASLALNLDSGDFAQIPRRVKDLYPAQAGLGRIIGESERAGWVVTPAYIGKRGTDPSYDLLRVELETGRGSRVARGTQDTIDWFVGKGGKVLARERYSNRRDRYRLQAVGERGGWKTIYEAEDNILPLSMAGVMPDESGLVFVQSNSGNGGFDSLMKLGFDGEISGPILGRDDREIDGVLTDRNRAVLGVMYAGLEPSYDFLDERLQAAYDAIQASLPNATIYLNSATDDRGKVLYKVFDPTLGDVWLTQLTETNSLAIIADARPDVPQEHIGGLYAIQYPASDGLSIPAIVTAPAGQDFADLRDAPAIILPHGGPATYDRFDFDWMAQFFASRGYLVLQPNFRGSTGFGRDFLEAGIGEWGGKMLSDIDDGVKALIKAGLIDPDRICIIGASYGGYAALAGATFTPDRYTCAIAIAPVSDLRKMLSRERRENQRGHWVIDYWKELMANGAVTPQQLDAISPAKHAENVRAPILLLHGDDDTVVDIEQSLVMERALKRANKQVEFVRLKGEDHWLSVAETRMQTLQAMDAFLKRYMPATPPPPVPTPTD